MPLVYDPEGRERPAIFLDPDTDTVKEAIPVYGTRLDAVGNVIGETVFLGHLTEFPHFALTPLPKEDDHGAR